jgi:hypothetical protein
MLSPAEKCFFRQKSAFSASLEGSPGVIALNAQFNELLSGSNKVAAKSNVIPALGGAGCLKDWIPCYPPSAKPTM